MTDYGTLRVPKDALETARESKREDETWGEFIQRCSENPPVVKEYVEADDIVVTLDATERKAIAEEVAEELQR